MDRIKQFINDESGIETLEYAVIGAIVCAVAVLIYGTGWGRQFEQHSYKPRPRVPGASQPSAKRIVASSLLSKRVTRTRRNSFFNLYPPQFC